MDEPDFTGDFKNAGLAQIVEQRTENPPVPGAIPGAGTNIKIGDFLEFGKREWATWKLARITTVEENVAHWSGPRTAYHYEVLACNKDKSGWTPSLKGKFYSGAPVFESPMKKVKFTELPLYISAPHKTSWFAEILKSPS